MNKPHITAQILRYRSEIENLRRKYPGVADTIFPRLIADRERRIAILERSIDKKGNVG